MSDFLAEQVFDAQSTIDGDDTADATHVNFSSLVTEPAFALALAVGVAFWFVVGLIVWGR